jgi:hypothetical protein
MQQLKMAKGALRLISMTEQFQESQGIQLQGELSFESFPCKIGGVKVLGIRHSARSDSLAPSFMDGWKSTDICSSMGGLGDRTQSIVYNQRRVGYLSEL